MEKPVIYVDIDGTLVNFVKQYARFHKRATGIYVDWKEVEHYNLQKSMPTAKEYEYLYNQDFYSDIEFFPFAVETVRKLKNEGYDIKFITTCVTFESMIGKYMLMEGVFPWFKIEYNWIVLSKKQHLITPNSVIIDDNVYFFPHSKFSYNVCHALKHNESIKHIVHLYTNNWFEIYNFIKGIK